MDLTTLPTILYKVREEAKSKWNESDTARAPTNRSPDQNTIKFEMGVMLFCAVLSGDIEETIRLLDKGADPNYANVDGLTALHNACIDEKFPMVKLLVDRGADVNATDNEGWSPLHAAASREELEIVKFLVNKGADVAAVNAERQLPIDLAEDDLIKEYLEDILNDSGIDADEARSLEHKTMLTHAKGWQKNGTIDDVRDSQLATPLHVAAANGYLDVTKLLLSIGADPNSRDNEDWTPLHAAVNWENIDIVKELIANGADATAINNIGNTPMDLASYVFKPKLIRALSEHQNLNNSKSSPTNRTTTKPSFQYKKWDKPVVGILKTEKIDEQKSISDSSYNPITLNEPPKPSISASIPLPISRPQSHSFISTKISLPPTIKPQFSQEKEIPRPPLPPPPQNLTRTFVVSRPYAPQATINSPSLSTSAPILKPENARGSISNKDSSSINFLPRVIAPPPRPASHTESELQLPDALVKIQKLEKQVENLKTEVRSLLKIIDNLRSEKKNETNKSPSSTHGLTSIAKPPIRK